MELSDTGNHTGQKHNWIPKGQDTYGRIQIIQSYKLQTIKTWNRLLFQLSFQILSTSVACCDATQGLLTSVHYL